MAYTKEELIEKLQERAEELGRTPTYKEMRNLEDYPCSSTYQDRFGSWSKAVKEAGLDPHNKGRGKGWGNGYRREDIEETLQHCIIYLHMVKSGLDLLEELTKLRPPARIEKDIKGLRGKLERIENYTKCQLEKIESVED